MPSAGSMMTRPMSGRPQAITMPTSRRLGPGRPADGSRAPSRSSLNSNAVIRMRAILAYSDGSIWKPPGRSIQPAAPLTVAPSGVSTASSPSRARP